MFCPKCNQQQSTDEIRFCSRCGFPLTGVADLLAHNGVPAMAATEMKDDQLSPRQKGVRQGVILLFVSLIVGFFTALLSVFVIGRPELFVSITAGLFFLSGILRVAYAYMFESGRQIAGQIPTQGHVASSEQAALPPLRSTAAGYWDRGVKTAEIVQPPSVTEKTTRLLDQELL